ncbi:hypothetical protein FB45DRAFT_522855 [Roridomyces roridus]|uniref:Uncharacterized protein n=1 Tax=Roridomyces roridus TaxID=1738132 RepID=A0AAD7FN62_9AGAR|nr:hypothetical protein FB45DRAFT_522855 [Roridomyces roridus]
MGAPPVREKNSNKGQLYGNRMKPVWVPSAQRGQVAAAPADWSRRHAPSLSRSSAGEHEADNAFRSDVPRRLPSLPSSPSSPHSAQMEEHADFSEEDEVIEVDHLSPSTPLFDHPTHDDTPEMPSEEVATEVDISPPPIPDDAPDVSNEVDGSDDEEETSDDDVDYTIIHFTPDYSLPPPPLSAVSVTKPTPETPEHASPHPLLSPALPALPPDDPGDADAD